MNRRGARSGHLRLVSGRGDRRSGRDLTERVTHECGADGLTNFEIDSDTIVDDASGTDWTSEFEDGQVTLSNDSNFTGSPVVQPDVGSSDADPDWLPNCPNSNFDSVFTGGTKIDDPTWVGDIENQIGLRQGRHLPVLLLDTTSIQSGPRAGHIVAYMAFTRRVFKGDGNVHFILSKGPDPDVRVAGDIVIEAEYDNKGHAAGPRAATWSDPGPTLGAFVAIGIDNPNVESSSARVFRRGRDRPHRARSRPRTWSTWRRTSCLAFGFGRVDLTHGQQRQLDLRDDGNRSGSTSTSAEGSSSRRRSPQRSRATRSSRLPSRPRRESPWTTPIRCSRCRRAAR